MRQVRDVLRLKAAGVSGNEIARRVRSYALRPLSDFWFELLPAGRRASCARDR
jgi:hypothetical protein